jgi:hypothetical protein
MTWFRNLLARASRPRPAPRPRLSVRPRLEALECRQLLNASTAFDAAGNPFTLVVDNAGTLTRTYLGQTATLATDVRRAHAYRDSDGSVGFTIIYNRLNAYDYDHTGGHFLGLGIVDVGKAFDRAGHLQEDITYATPGGYVTYEYTSTGAHQVPQQGFFEITIHPFQDRQGNLGEDVTYFRFNADVFLAGTLIEYDSSGAHYMVKDAVADRAYGPSGQQVAFDVTYYTSFVAVEYTNSSATVLGMDIPG